MAKLLYLTDSEHATTWYRSRVPAAYFHNAGHEVVLDNKFNQQVLDWCDIFIIQRTNQKEIKEAVQYVNSLGKLTVMDLDDNYWDMINSNPAWESWNQPGVLTDFTDILRICKLMTTTTESLAKLIRRYNDNVVIVPNSLPDDFWNNVPKYPRSNDNIVIGWAGSTSHYYDLQEVAPLYTQFLTKYPNVEFQVAGVGPHWFPRLERLVVVEPAKIEMYPQLLTRFDIGIAPLRDTKFNESKSNLKFLEYSAVEIPTVASKTITYSDSITQGVNGFLAKNAKEWIKYLSFLIENPEERVKMGQEARKFAEENMMSKTIYKWASAYGIEV